MGIFDTRTRWAEILKKDEEKKTKAEPAFRKGKETSAPKINPQKGKNP